MNVGAEAGAAGAKDSPGRIVVAVDCSAHGRAAAEAAADLALRLRAQLTALFVEDVELLHLAGLPFVREIGRGGEVRPLDPATIERGFRREVREVRDACEKAAGRCRITMRFDVVRGRVPSALAEAAAGAELLVVGRSGAGGLHRGARRAALGRTLQALLAPGGPPVALIGEGSGDGRPLAVVQDDGEASRRAFALALRLAGGEGSRDLADAGGPVVIRVGAGQRSGPETDTVQTGSHEVRIEADAASLAAKIRELGCRAVVLDRESSLSGAGLVELVEALDCPVFVTG